ncbi:glycosyltransferase family 2 protein [Candidatus Methylopumilus universalis]|uniref:glycosyltransferase family A protein n=1 Tax=Candidatus Methylopumilus universalis TaxID=2588536 RepID=UPI0011225A16|nr:glycosyltransferase family A protein [Candidatus Methylopumilus universalis]QDC47511.1 glycosyltransferase family 2 protein [Candidatus Methylopumilus universalis]QDC72044.1 glycosyltransferase family 2 protein [Candidatus Methylopumilus universalis]
MKVSPIVLFVYNRYLHTRQTIDALLKNSESNQHDLIIFSDAPQSLNENEAVIEVRSYLKTIKGFRSIKIYYRDINFGLAKSIVEGVTEVLKSYDSIIVLEDDIVTSPFFLNFMNNALARFEEDERVISIHGYVYPTKEKLPDVFFLKGADCWGWATWKRGWQLFNVDGMALLKELKSKNLIKEFDFNNSHVFSKMLKDQIKGKNNSWAVRWYASAFLAGKLTLYPGRSLVNNIGNDGSGRHCGESNKYDSDLSMKQVKFDDIKIEHSQEAFHAFEKFFISAKTSPLIKLWCRIKKLFI